LDAFGSTYVRSVRETPPEGPTACNTVSQVDNRADRARAYGVRHKDDVHHHIRIIHDGALRAFRLPEHMLRVGGCVRDTNTQATAYSACCMSLEHRVKVKLQDGGESTGRIVKPSMHVADFHKDRLHFRACVVLGFQKVLST
jgi:hypothetical protein